MRIGGPVLLVVLALSVPARAGAPGPAAEPAAAVPAPAPAAVPAAPIRTGTHPGFGRVVFDLPAGASWTLDRAGDRLTVRFSGAEPLAGAAPPRNVRVLTAAAGVAELLLAPGVQVRQVRMGERLVLDLLDPAAPAAAVVPPVPQAAPAPPRPAAPAARPATPPVHLPAAVPPAAPVAAPPRVPGEKPAGPPLPPPASPIPIPAPANTVSAGPIALAAVPVPPGGAVLLPFATDTGAAAFRRGDEAVLVFDERRPIDTEVLRGDRVFATGQISLLSAATVLRLRLPAGRALRLSHGEAGWTVAVGDEPALRPIRPDLDTGAGGPRLRLPAGQPGRSVAVPDPLTGGILLVGTQRDSGEGVAVPRTTPEFGLLATWQGVAVAAVSDALVLHQTAAGFTLGSALPRGGLVLAKADTDLAALDDAMRLTRRFDFPALPIPALLRRLQAAVAGTGAVPAAMRTAPRLATAEAMLALGLGAEAQAVLSVAAASDPHAVDDPVMLGLSAIAALLAGRAGESAGLDDPRLTGTDEVALWRGLRAATLREGSPEAAAVLAAELPLLLAYPTPLRSRFLPLAAETLALGGEAEAAQQLVERRPDEAGLDYARALLAEKRDHAAALAILDRLAKSPDRRQRARAAPKAVELRLAANEITPAAAADALEKLLYAWRGDASEVALRLRAAGLRAQAGGARAALTMLREATEALPEAREALHGRMVTIFAAAVADEAAAMSPLDLVALAGENPDLIPEGDAGLLLATKLAERLAALDLPRRAAPVLEKLVAAAAPGVVRAELGGRLAATRLLLGDPAGALSALGATVTDSLPPPVLEARTLTWARATAAAGDPAAAAAGLEAQETAAALELRAHLLEQAKNWKGATAALRLVADRIVPADGALTEAQAATLLRLAAAAARAGDEAVLGQLRGHDLARLPPGHTADMLRLLTEKPVQMPGDLPRARRETALASGLLAPAGR